MISPFAHVHCSTLADPGPGTLHGLTPAVAAALVLADGHVLALPPFDGAGRRRRDRRAFRAFRAFRALGWLGAGTGGWRMRRLHLPNLLGSVNAPAARSIAPRG